MKPFPRFKLWLSRITASVFLAESVMRDKLNKIKTVSHLVAHTGIWNPEGSDHGKTTSIHLRIAVRRLMSQSHLGLVDGYSPVRFEHHERLEDLNAAVYDISIGDGQGNWSTIPYMVLANYDDYELYVVATELIVGPVCVSSMIEA